MLLWSARITGQSRTPNKGGWNSTDWQISWTQSFPHPNWPRVLEKLSHLLNGDGLCESRDVDGAVLRVILLLRPACRGNNRYSPTHTSSSQELPWYNVLAHGHGLDRPNRETWVWRVMKCFVDFIQWKYSFVFTLCTHTLSCDVHIQSCHSTHPFHALPRWVLRSIRSGREQR